MAIPKEDQDRFLFAESLFGMRIEASLAGIRDRIIAEGGLETLSPRQIRILDDARMNSSFHEWIDETEQKSISVSRKNKSFHNSIQYSTIERTRKEKVLKS